MAALPVPQNVPQHVAIIMDGNGRWATQRARPRIAGHHAGVEVLRHIVEHAVRRDIRILTVYAFSSENWQRPNDEINMLLQLFMTALESELDNLCQHQVCLRFTGRLEVFPSALQEAMADAEAATRDNAGLRLNVATNYGGRWDLTRACQRLVHKYAGQPGALPGEAEVAAELALADCADPELFIRTGGEYRISNYLLWQLAYTELYFTDTPWPEFSTADFDTALDWYTHRQRRFGRTAEQLNTED